MVTDLLEFNDQTRPLDRADPPTDVLSWAPSARAAVVSADPALAASVADLLERRGHRVAIYPDLSSAEKLVDLPPDLLVVSDDLLHGESALELASRLRRLEPPERLGILALVGPSEHALVRAHAAGADDAIPRTAARPLVAAKCTRLLRGLRAQAPHPPTSLTPGSVVFGRYRIDRVLGRGGFGAVYAATDQASGAAVALKIAAGGEPDRAERFMREAYCLTAVKSRHVVRVVEFGSRRGLDFCAMERVEGPTLYDHVVASGSCDPAQAEALLRGLASGLAALATRELVHRDVKPLNVILREGRYEEPVLIDFGLAKRSFDRGITSPDILLGSPGYVAPEQLDGEADARSDLFALGQVTLFALTGFDPFAWLDRFERIQAMARQQTQIPAGLPPRLAAVLDRLTRLDPAERYPSARALLRELDEGPCAPRSEPASLRVVT